MSDLIQFTIWILMVFLRSQSYVHLLASHFHWTQWSKHELFSKHAYYQDCISLLLLSLWKGYYILNGSDFESVRKRAVKSSSLHPPGKKTKWCFLRCEAHCHYVTSTTHCQKILNGERAIFLLQWLLSAVIQYSFSLLTIPPLPTNPWENRSPL